MEITTTTVGITHNQLPNNDLTLENQELPNVGIDFSCFNRLSGSVEYYVKKSSALLCEVPLVGSTGLDAIISNLVGMKNLV